MYVRVCMYVYVFGCVCVWEHTAATELPSMSSDTIMGTKQKELAKCRYVFVKVS